MKAMAAMGVTTFVEVGPGTVLTGLIRRILPEATTLECERSEVVGCDIKRVKAGRLENSRLSTLT